MFDLPPDPPKFWLPSKPAIIRSAADIRKPGLGFLPGLAASVAKRRPVLTWISSNGNGTNSASRTFTAQNIGTASANRLVIVCAMGGESNSGGASQFTGLTIGGVSATIHVNPGGARSPTAIASLVVAAGTTADIVTTRTGATGPHMISVYTLTGYLSATPTDTDGTNNGSSVTSRNASLDLNSNGVAVFALGGYNAMNPVSWSSATKDVDTDAGSFSYSSASRVTSSALTPLSETATFDGSSISGISAVSWA